MMPLVSKVDFHVHSTVSDGSFAPEGVLELALRAGIGVLSITDHDAIEGFDRAAERLRERGPTARPSLRLIAGVELSTTFEQEEIHVLGYFPGGVPDALRGTLDEAGRARIARIEEGCRNLARLGVRVAVEDVLRLSPGRSVGRSHLARALVDGGHALSIADAFTRFLAPSKALVPPSRSGAEAATALVAELGGVAALAHPPLERADRIVAALVPRGLAGIEVYGKRRRGVDTLYLETLADAHGLLRTAGSDWHGHGKTPNLTGVQVMTEKIAPFLERLT